jgi:hypothetical protein
VRESWLRSSPEVLVECQQGPQGPGVQSLSSYPGPGGSCGRGVSAILPASKEAASPSRITIPYHTIPPPPPMEHGTLGLQGLSPSLLGGGTLGNPPNNMWTPTLLWNSILKRVHLSKYTCDNVACKCLY